ncbi:antibiotic biosynthesis monooxygenase family protein [Prosthecomicrobium hirschii]|uniref:antibiotic biosynthesis monooxygenase family protein n=1 Tax=Prosthecodimorpha hirschii TaxID=665126 RepID=UPI00221F200C|nr:antibiotic biosynthesis monooxygenase family protein [Prosthecomicrobium hirschii]MCW1840850.1 antibiotic biosynthesis monooxygenase [Prosthecomicrobium hirschii]
MLAFRPLDPADPVQVQLALQTGPVALADLFTLDPADEPAFPTVWAENAAVMKAHPGFISTQLPRAIGNRPTYFNDAVREPSAHFRTAFGSPEFRATFGAHPPSGIASRHLFAKVAVPGICVA